MNRDAHETPAGDPAAPTSLWRRSRIVALCGAVALAVVSVWLSSTFEREPPTASAQPRGITVKNDTISLVPDAPQWRVLKLGAAAPAAAGWSGKIPARVQIDQTRASRVGTPLAGRITAVLVELGQSVKAGDPLFSVMSPEIATLKAEQDKARVDLAVGRRNYERVKAMVEARALPAKEEINAHQQLVEAEVAARLAESKLASLRVSRTADNEFTVTAPRSGVVVEKNVLPAQEVQADASGSLLVIADLSELWVVADLFEADAGRIRPGASARVTFPYLPGEELDAPVDMVSTVVDPVRHTVPVRLRLRNTGGRLRPNSYAEVRLSTDVAPGTVSVASSAIVSNGAKQYVFVQGVRGEFSKREVVTGASSGDTIVILSGLAPGEVVVEEGAVLLDNHLTLAS